jgi:hypothetical protein
MENAYPPTKPRSWRFLLVLVLVSIIIGLALAGWALTRSEKVRGWILGGQSATPQTAITYAPPTTTATPPETSALGKPADVTPEAVSVEAAGRLASLEARMAKVESTQTSSGDSGRAEGLLIAFAARRALEKGMALGYMEGELNRQFGQSQPRAVAMIIAASRQPVTRDTLAAELDALAPQLAGAPADRSWWDSVKESMGSLIIVRQAGTPSPDPVLRVSHARDMIEGGRVDQALAEVARLPNRAVAASWIADARRYVEAQRALDLLEAAAIMPQTAPVKAAPPVAPPAAVVPTPAGDGATL